MWLAGGVLLILIPSLHTSYNLPRREVVPLSTGIVFDIKKYSIHDGPGIRTTVFFKGCPLRCWWCHNPEGQVRNVELVMRESRCIHCGSCLPACDRGAISRNGKRFITNRELCNNCGLCTEVCNSEARELIGRDMSVEQVMAEIDRDIPFYDESGGGVTLSGGEPLFQPDFAFALLQASKIKEIRTTLDTCGYVSWDTFEQVRDYVDLFMYDLKLLNNARHRHFTGVSNEMILKNLRTLSQLGHNIILRVPIIPGVNDDPDNLSQLGSFAASLPHLKSVDLLPYHRIGIDKYARLHQVYRLPDTRSPSDQRMAEIASVFEPFELPVNIGG